MIKPLYNFNLALWLEICFLLWNDAQISYLSSLMQSVLPIFQAPHSLLACLLVLPPCLCIWEYSELCEAPSSSFCRALMSGSCRKHCLPFRFAFTLEWIPPPPAAPHLFSGITTTLTTIPTH